MALAGAMQALKPMFGWTNNAEIRRRMSAWGGHGKIEEQIGSGLLSCSGLLLAVGKECNWEMSGKDRTCSGLY